VLLARKDKMIRTLSNRRRLLPFINSTDRTKKKRSERQAINTPIQGTASDIIKAAMYSIDIRLSRLYHDTLQGTPARLILNVHDELVYEVAEVLVEEAAELIKEEMENAVCLSCDIPVCMSQGNRFGSLKPLHFEAKSPLLQLLNHPGSPFVILRGAKASCLISTNPLRPGHCVVASNDSLDSWLVDSFLFFFSHTE
jgi:hypothetical protein